MLMPVSLRAGEAANGQAYGPVNEPPNNPAPAPDAGLRVLIRHGRVARAVGEVDREAETVAHSSIGAARFRRRPLSLPDVLEQEVGVQLRPSGGVGSPATIMLRGASSAQVMIYLDGAPLNDAAGSPVDLSLIPLDNLERIDVYRGATPLELGQAGIGGAVNLISRRGIDSKAVGAATSLGLSLGSFSTTRLSASHRWRDETNDLLLSGSALQSANDFPYVNDNGTPDNGADDRVERRRNAGVRHLAALLNWRRRIDARREARLRFDISRRRKALPDRLNSAANRALVDTGSLNLLAGYRLNEVLPGLALDGRVTASARNEVFDDSRASIGFVAQHSESRTRKGGLQGFAEYRTGASLWKAQASAGLETYRRDSTAASVALDTSRRRRFELALAHRRGFFDAHLETALLLRYQGNDDHLAGSRDLNGQAGPAIDRQYRFLKPQLGLKYRFSRRHVWRFNIGRYDRAPSFRELFGADGILLGNPALQAETSLNADVGLHYGWFAPWRWWHGAAVDVSLFENRVDNLIAPIYNAQGQGRSVNIANAVIRGVEGSLQLSPTPAQQIHLDYSFTDSRNDSPVAGFQGKRLPYYYRHDFGLRYTFKQASEHGAWQWRFEARLKRDMFYDRANLLPGDAVNLLNAGVQYDFAGALSGLRVDLALHNLRDENIRYLRNRPTPGRQLYFTVSGVF